MRTNNGFWIFESNLLSTLLILSHLVSYEFDSSDFDAIKFGLEDTSADKDIWYDYQLIGDDIIDMKIAYEEDDRDIIFFSLLFEKDLADKINLIIDIVQEFDVKVRNKN